MTNVYERLKYNVSITPTQHGWKVSSIGTSFLDWMRQCYPEEENKTWQLWYYSGSMAIIEVIEERIVTMITLRWT